MNLAARLGRAIESGKAVHAMEAARRVAPGLIPKAGASSRVVEELEAKPPSHLPADPKANLSVVLSTRALAGLQTFHARELAHPFSKPNQGNRTQKITINSSPTVVINAAAPGSNVRHEVIEALRAHRDELFDQLKRESARRERAQF